MSTYKYVKQLGYGNIGEYINSGPNGTIDMSRLNNILQHMAGVGVE